MFSRRDHILGHKTRLNKFKRVKLYQAYFLTIETGNQLQEEKRKNQKYMQIKQPASKGLMDKRRNQTGNQKLPLDK